MFDVLDYSIINESYVYVHYTLKMKEEFYMNKAELIAAMSENADITKKDAEKALKAFLEITTDALKQKKNVQIIGFGTFMAIERSERNGVNPSTGEKIKIKKSIAVKFEAGKPLKDIVNK